MIDILLALAKLEDIPMELIVGASELLLGGRSTELPVGDTGNESLGGDVGGANNPGVGDTGNEFLGDGGDSKSFAGDLGS